MTIRAWPPWRRWCWMPRGVRACWPPAWPTARAEYGVSSTRLERAQATGERGRCSAPCGYAAFYRKSALDGRRRTIQSRRPAADVELGAELQARRLSGNLRAAAHVYARARCCRAKARFARASAPSGCFGAMPGLIGWTKSLALHPLVVAVDTIWTLPNPAIVLRLAGRLWACCQVDEYVRHYHGLHHDAEPADVFPIEPAASRLRIDGSHAGTGEPRFEASPQCLVRSGATGGRS